MEALHERAVRSAKQLTSMLAPLRRGRPASSWARVMNRSLSPVAKDAASTGSDRPPAGSRPSAAARRRFSRIVSRRACTSAASAAPEGLLGSECSAGAEAADALVAEAAEADDATAACADPVGNAAPAAAAAPAAERAAAGDDASAGDAVKSPVAARAAASVDAAAGLDPAAGAAVDAAATDAGTDAGTDTAGLMNELAAAAAALTQPGSSGSGAAAAASAACAMPPSLVAGSLIMYSGLRDRNWAAVRCVTGTRRAAAPGSLTAQSWWMTGTPSRESCENIGVNGRRQREAWRKE